MNQEVFKIESRAIDVEDLMKKIQSRVESKEKSGTYDLFNLENLPQLELSDIKNEEDMLKYSLKVIQRSCEINIGDYPIVQDGKGFIPAIEVVVKKVIWKLLRFYTFRMFSQQKEFNHQVVNVALSIKKYYDEKTQKLEARISQLEQNQNL